jgi:ribonucleoside-triphosphate reductase
MIQNIIKRDSTLEPYNPEKISLSIKKAGVSVSYNFTDEELCLLTSRVNSFLAKEYKDFDKLDIEKVQDATEKALIEKKLVDVSKAYILYREQRRLAREATTAMVDAVDIMDGYLQESDWRAKENSNVTYSIGGLILHNSSSVTANYWLKKIYPKAIGDAHINADFHLHDLGMFAPYCCGHSLRQLIEMGIRGVAGKVASAPASHLSTLVAHMVNFLGIMQNEWAGAQAFSSFDTYLAPFVKKDNLTASDVRQCMQNFLWGINTPSRWGTQAPFSNITLDWVVPADMAEKYPVIGKDHTKMDFQYKDCQAEMDMINRELLKLYLEGDAEGRGFQYPIPTINITPNFDWENPNCEYLFELTAKYGTPYFQNFVNSDLNPSDVRSMCLTPDARVTVRSQEDIFKVTYDDGREVFMQASKLKQL